MPDHEGRAARRTASHGRESLHTSDADRAPTWGHPCAEETRRAGSWCHLIPPLLAVRYTGGEMTPTRSDTSRGRAPVDCADELPLRTAHILRTGDCARLANGDSAV